MARKNRSRAGSARDTGDAAKAARDSAQKIWLAGLGAFERARTEGPRMFEALVEQGRTMGARAVGMADQALKTMREADYTGGRWDKLEQVFEDRVARALAKLGVYTQADVQRLAERVDELAAAVNRLSNTARAKRGSARAAAPKKPAGTATAKRKRATRG